MYKMLMIIFFIFIKNQFVQFGGVLRDNEKVTDIVPGETVHVKTTKALYKTRKLILTPGIEETNCLEVSPYLLARTQTKTVYCRILPTRNHHV